MSAEKAGMAARLSRVGEGSRALTRRHRAAVPDVEPLPETKRPVVPAPRRARMFIRHGGGHGVFSDVTLTSPVRPKDGC